MFVSMALSQLLFVALLDRKNPEIAARPKYDCPLSDHSQCPLFHTASSSHLMIVRVGGRPCAAVGQGGLHTCAAVSRLPAGISGLLYLGLRLPSGNHLGGVWVIPASTSQKIPLQSASHLPALYCVCMALPLFHSGVLAMKSPELVVLQGSPCSLWNKIETPLACCLCAKAQHWFASLINCLFCWAPQAIVSCCPWWWWQHAASWRRGACFPSFL